MCGSLGVFGFVVYLSIPKYMENHSTDQPANSIANQIINIKYPSFEKELKIFNTQRQQKRIENSLFQKRFLFDIWKQISIGYKQ